jgi:hypothetical protein
LRTSSGMTICPLDDIFVVAKRGISCLLNDMISLTSKNTLPVDEGQARKKRNRVRSQHSTKPIPATFAEFLNPLIPQSRGENRGRR